MNKGGRAVTVGMPAIWLWLLVLGGAVLGLGAGFGVGPLVNWLVDAIGSAPGPLRLAAQLPTVWAVPVLTAVGAAAGGWAAAAAHGGCPLVTVDDDHVTVRAEDSGLQLPRARVGSVFTDGRDLVLLGHDGGELVRTSATDLPKGKLRAAFEEFGHPWRGTTDPHEAEFTRWTDGTPDLDEAAHALLRKRGRALADKQPGAAAEALDRLRTMGIAVRDRDRTQQYRRVRSPEDDGG